MMIYIRKQLFPILLGTTAFVLTAELILRVLNGYIPGGFYIFVYLTAGIRYLLILICLAVTIRSTVNRRSRIIFALSWIFLAVAGIMFNQIPDGPFETIGGLLSIYGANPEQVRDDTRRLADEYPPMTCIGYENQRYPCDAPITRDKLPASIRDVHVGNVLILDRYILIEKSGLEGTFRGFVVFREGADLWKNEKAITFKNGCTDCSKIRITDGLYWYHADPLDPLIFMSTLK